MAGNRLILADNHALEPFTVPSYQFSCRAASFARNWPGPVELWLAGPAVTREQFEARIGAAAPDNLTLFFGPPARVRILGLKLASRSWFRRWMTRLIRERIASGEKPVFYLRTLRLAEALLPEFQRQNLPFAFEPHEIFHESARPGRVQEIRHAEVEVYSRAACLFPISYSLRSRLQEVFSSAAPMLVGPLGHSGANFTIEPYDPDAPSSLLYIGSLHKWKGLDTAFAASAGLNIPFHVVGDAGGLERCQEYCREQDLVHVTFHGQVNPEQTRRFYEPGCICVLPLSHEQIAQAFTSPLKIFDYMAAGRPILAGDVPTVRELLTDGENARLAEVGNVPVWNRVLQELLGQRAESARLAANARKAARACTWDERAKPLVEKLQSLV